MRQSSIKWSPDEGEATFALTSPQITLCCELLHRRKDVPGASEDPHRLALLNPLCRNERVKETPSASLYASPAKAGAYRSTTRAQPLTGHCDCFKEIPSGGGMGRLSPRN